MVAFDEKVFRELDKDAKSRNISFQAFLRAVVIPESIQNGNRATSNTPTMRETQSKRDSTQTLFGTG
jgi:hypothetical protein